MSTAVIVVVLLLVLSAALVIILVCYHKHKHRYIQIISCTRTYIQWNFAYGDPHDNIGRLREVGHDCTLYRVRQFRPNSRVPCLTMCTVAGYVAKMGWSL